MVKKIRYIHILKKKYQSIRKKIIIREMYVAKRLMINVKSIGYFPHKTSLLFATRSYHVTEFL